MKFVYYKKEVLGVYIEHPRYGIAWNNIRRCVEEEQNTLKILKNKITTEALVKKKKYGKRNGLKMWTTEMGIQDNKLYSGETTEETRHKYIIRRNQAKV